MDARLQGMPRLPDKRPCGYLRGANHLETEIEGQIPEALKAHPLTMRSECRCKSQRQFAEWGFV